MLFSDATAAVLNRLAVASRVKRRLMSNACSMKGVHALYRRIAPGRALSALRATISADYLAPEVISAARSGNIALFPDTPLVMCLVLCDE